jgi:CPA2 family monovalent cation:H+ antiporter-2
MHNVELILTLTAALTGALVLGFVALRLSLPPIVGYLVAGIIIGPYTPGYVANRGLAEQLAEVGVILLMFGVGLHFHLKDLLAVRNIALTGALVQIASATALGAVAVHALGWTWAAGIVFGIALSVASTVVLTRVLADHRDLQTQTGRIAVGWLVVEDVFTVFALVVLPVLVTTGGQTPPNLPVALALSALKLGVLAILTLWPGAHIIPRLLAAAARTHSRELFTLTVLVIALGIAVASAELFGVSMALGAFLAGMVVGQSEFSYRAASEALPMRDAFAVLFFVSVGMLFDPQRLLAASAVTMIALGIVLLGKPLAAFLISVLLGYGARVGLRVAVALAQIGEFSFMLAVLGGQLGILPDGAMDSIVAASIISITINPLLYRAIPGIEKRLLRGRLGRTLQPRAGRPDAGPGAESAGAESEGVIVVGYGPVGEGLCRLLLERGISPTVIELNIDTVRRLHRHDIRAVYGDAGQPEVLEEAGIRFASAVIISAPGSPEFSEVIRTAKTLNPAVPVFARSAFLSHTKLLQEAGADEVFSAEAEVATAMIGSVLLRLGATPEETAAERERARANFYV